jgi:hypothetical protein
MGTHDVSILELGDGVFEVKSTSGDVHLGGDDIDNTIIDYLAEEFDKEYHIDLRKDPMANQRLKEAAEKAKIELSSSVQTEINLPYIMPVDGVPKHLVQTLTKAKFEQLIEGIVKRTIEPCKVALKRILDYYINVYQHDEYIFLSYLSLHYISIDVISLDFRLNKLNKSACKAFNFGYCKIPDFLPIFNLHSFTFCNSAIRSSKEIFVLFILL